MADTLRIYHKRDQTFEKELIRLKKSNISRKNKELISEFHNHLFAKSCNIMRVSKLSSQLRRICPKVDKDLDKLLLRDLEKLISLINLEKNHALETKADYRRCIKQFYLWYEDRDERLSSNDEKLVTETKTFYKYVKKSIKTKCKVKEFDFKTIITDKDIDYVIEHGTTNIREKAFLKLLHETGARAGEFLNIKLKDIQITPTKAMIRVDGKTGPRTIPVVNSVPYLVQFLDFHPFKNDKESYLWLGECRRYMHMPLMHRGGQKFIDRCFERAGMLKREYAEVKLENGKTMRKLIKRSESKKCNFHWFRHSRATLLAPKLTEALLCRYMGWTLGSRQVRRYVHMCNEQLEEAILEMHGLEDKKVKQEAKPQICRCGTLNNALARYCYKCGNPLNVTVAMEDQETMQKETDDTLKEMFRVLSNPEMMKKFEEFKRLMQK